MSNKLLPIVTAIAVLFTSWSVTAQSTKKPLVVTDGKIQTLKGTDTLSLPNDVTFWGAIGDGTTDDGVATSNAITSAGVGGTTVFPHRTNGYKLDSGGFPLGTYPSQTWSWPNNTGVYPSAGLYSLGNNRFQGSAIGNPENCTGFLFSPYTQTCLAITDYKLIMDPASVWSGPNTTNVGLSIGCLPNHRSPNTSNVKNGYRRNWIACMYWEADTGQDGQPNGGGSGFGSSISTEVVNATLDVGSNHGILQEDNVNIYGAPTDGGITRDHFILASCGPFSSGTFSGTVSCQQSVKSGKSPWGVTSEFGTAIEIGATPFTSTTAPSTQTNGNGETTYSGSIGNYSVYPRWTNGVDASGSVFNYTARGVVTGESGQYFRAVNAAGSTVAYIDKANANFNTTGSVTAGAYGSFTGSVQINGPNQTFRFLHFDTAGVSRWEVGEDAGTESGSNTGSNFYISRRSDAGSAVDQPLSINRSTGVVSLSQPLPLASGGTGTTTASSFLDTSLGSTAQRVAYRSSTGWGSQIPRSINVMAAPYNAVCNGSTNDAAAFNSAISAAGTNGAVFVPPGKSCVINSTVTISNNGVELDCGGSILQATSGAQNILSISGAYAHVQNCKINATGGFGSVGIWITGHHALIENNLVYSMASHGIGLDGQSSSCAQNIIRDNEIYSNGGIGVADNKCPHVRIISNHIHDNALEGVSVDNAAHYSIVSNNEIIHNGTGGGTGGIGTDFSNYIVISNNVIQSTVSLPGIAINNQLGNSDHGVISGNTLLSNGGTAIYFHTCTGAAAPIAACTTAGATLNFSVTGNNTDGAGGSMTINAGSNNNLVVGNQFSAVSVTNNGTGNILANNF